MRWHTYPAHWGLPVEELAGRTDIPPHWRGDPDFTFRPAPPVEWTVWNLCQAYQCTPSVAWRELGGCGLTRRELHRLTMAASDLGGLHHAFEDVGRKRGDKDRPADREHVLMVRRATAVFEEAEQAEWDAQEAEIELVIEVRKAEEHWQAAGKRVLARARALLERA